MLKGIYWNKNSYNQPKTVGKVKPLEEGMERKEKAGINSQ